MDVIFGSEGTAQADFERMEEINREIGLDTLLRGAGGSGHSEGGRSPNEKGFIDGSEKDVHVE
jgi:hypothetical protein